MDIKEEQILNLPSKKRRIVAFLIDHFVMASLIISLIFLGLGSDFMVEDNNDNKEPLLLIIVITGFFLYFAKDAFKGISIGKWSMRIMVRDEKSPTKIPSFGRLLLRNLLILLWPIEFIAMAINKRKRRLGDKIAKTIVVKNPNKLGKFPRLLILTSIAAVFFTFTFFFFASAMKNSDAYKVAIQEIENNPEILTKTGGIKGYGIIPIGNIHLLEEKGEAQLKIKVIGNNKDLNVNVYLEKKPNCKWELIEMK